ncbi:MAG: DUF4012 domain-containing protein [Candidatus Doudnabacteria bacterium]|nr:DUF4012 domain-containing protein [Candidatus Doudnabacteria bacterium]
MAKAKKFKLYTDSRRFLALGSKSSNPAVVLFGKLVGLLFNFFYRVGYSLVVAVKAVAAFFYLVGDGLVKSLLKIFSAARGDFIKTAKTLPRRLKNLSTKHFAQSLGVFLAVALAGWAIIGIFKYMESALEAKDQVMSSAQSGGRYLEQAVADIQNRNLASAQDKLSLAIKFFSQSRSDLSGQNILLGQVVKVLPQGRDATALLQSAELVARAAQDMVDFQEAAGQLHISAAGMVSQNQQNGAILTELETAFSRAQSNLNKAAGLIANVDPASVPQQYQKSFIAVQQNLQVFKLTLNGAARVFSLARNIISGQKNILILFENNNELRPTGGFMGTFGSLQTQDGQIQQMNVSSIYDLDGQLKDIIQPPLPIAAVTDRWYLRDSNWFADFPASARKISEFYQKEGGQNPDIIVAMTPDLIVDWLKISGPVQMPKYGVTLTADNFVEQTQAITTISDNMPTNSPKQMLADFVPVLLQKISSADKNSLLAYLAALQQNLASKQIAVYSSDPGLEKQIQTFNWGGNLWDTDSDYLMLLDSNLGATKTSLAVSEDAELTSNIGVDGTVTDQLKITRTNHNPNNPDNSNVSYLRVYVPAGSTLISSTGFEKRDLQYSDKLEYQIDSDVNNIVKNSVTENLTGTTIGLESGKTFFGNWITIDPGESTTTTLVYKLPFKLNNLDHFSLMVQKQMGAVNNNLTWSVNYAGRKVLWQNFKPSKQATAAQTSDIIIDKDYLMGMVLEK